MPMQRERAKTFGAKMFFCVILLLLLDQVRDVFSQVTLDKDLKRFVGTLEEYSVTPNEVVFLVDESGSIGAENFPQEIVFTELIARILTVSADTSRVAVITFSTGHVTHMNYIKDSEGNNMCTFLKDLQKIEYRGGWTHTRDGLITSGDLLKNSRPNANRIIILISDGQSNNGDPLPIAKDLKAKGIIIFAVGVADINEDELLAIATSPDHIYILRDFLYIKKVNEDLQDDIKEVKWDFSQDSNLCNKFCAAGEDCCDLNADCYCGTKGGRYECACRPGYYGTGHQRECKLCPKGTYKAAAGPASCSNCPANSTTTKEGSTSISECFCLPGHEGNPHKNQSCTPVSCVKLAAPEGGILVPFSCGNTFNSECSFKCNKGHCPYFCNKTTSVSNEIQGIMPWNIKPAEPRKCLDTRQWSGVEFNCEKIRCAALNFPINGQHNCSGSDFTFGTTCQLDCEKGYQLSGSTFRTCLVSGSWTGEETFCKAGSCLPLKVNKNLKVKPEECGQKNMTFRSTCQYFCKKGFRLEIISKFINNSMGIRECLSSREWSGKEEAITCKDDSPPTIKCPKGIVQNTDSNKPTARVVWELPEVKDNVHVQRVSIISPAGIKKPPYHFPIGDTTVVYEAVDEEKLRSTCSFIVTVKDVERPRIVRKCPDDKEVFYEKQKPGIAVTWDEPVFKDNSGTIVSPFQNRKSGDLFSWGPPSLVKYKVEDPSGNTETCSFYVKVKPYPCPYSPPPAYGSIACDKWVDGRFCTVFCNEGYDFVEDPEPVYYCFQTPLRWGSLPGSPRRPGGPKFPWPDCAKRQSPVGSNVNMKMKYTVKNCAELGNSKEEIAKKFIEILKDIAKKRRLPALCSEKLGCKVKNVNITCGHIPQGSQPRQKRDTESTDDVSHSFRNRALQNRDILPDGHHIRHQKHKRQAVFDDSLIISIEFDIPQVKIPEVDPSDEYCQECNKTAELIPPSLDILQTTADILQDFKENFTEVVQVIYPDALPDKSFSTEYSVDPLCLPGQIPRNQSCVNCPIGSFFDVATVTCKECPLDTFQDSEASLSCQRCPEGTKTLQLNSKSLDDCRELCRPGTYSSTGLEPCIACPNKTFQSLVGQKNCIRCPSGTTTWTVGVQDLNGCTSVCTEGTYSDTGFRPCTACPHGTFQPQSQQVTCIPCPEGQTTLVEGAHTEQYCKVVDFCADKQPCQHGSTCINKENGYECVCLEGFMGENCETNVDDCSPDLCQNNGTCVDGINNYTCRCLSGFTGFACESNIDDCISDPCLNGATCIDGINNFVCKCDNGFTGGLCEINFYDCASDPCQNGGTCFDMQENFRCCCPKGYTGHLCEKLVDKCDDSPCQNGATCIPKFDGFNCVCPSGYSGTLCDVNIDDCLTASCENGGTCQDGLDTFTCECPSLYAGDRCEKVLDGDYSLNFPSAVTSNFIQLDTNRHLYAVTVSFWMKTSYKDSYGTPVSYSYLDPVRELQVENGLTILDVNKIVLYLHGQSFHTGIVGNSDSSWHHCAVTWDSSSGNWAFFWDGAQRQSGTGLAVGRYLWSGHFVLGQEQDSVGGGFSMAEAYVGEISQFNVWDYSMTTEEIKEVKSRCGLLGNVIQWPQVMLNLHGDVSIIEHADICSDIGRCSAGQCNCIDSNSSYNEVCRRNINCYPNPCANSRECMTVQNETTGACNCQLGFAGKLCEYDVNECLEDNGNCSHLCTNTLGSYTCSCPIGMTLKQDAHNCMDTRYCTTGGLIYLDGETWPANCQECTCSQGIVSCLDRGCQNITCGQNEKVTTVPGECCPICSVETTTCTLFDNNTFHTFDGLEYEFSGRCRYTLAEDCINGQFSVRFENSEENTTQKVVTVHIHCAQIIIRPPGDVSVDGTTVTLPYHDNIVHVERENNEIWVKSQKGFSVTWNHSGKVQVHSPPFFKSQLCGLCGDFNNVRMDDFTTKQHLPARTVAELGHSWKVDGYKFCRLPKQLTNPKAQGRIPLTGTCKFASFNMQRRAQKACSILRKKSFQKCYNKVKPQEYYDLCLQDSCSCKFNEPCFCDAISAYVLECRRNNVTIEHWTKDNICELRCTNGMVYDDCGPPCPQTCNSTQIVDPQCYLNKCVPRCHCPAGRLLHEGRCILPKDCPWPYIEDNNIF